MLSQLFMATEPLAIQASRVWGWMMYCLPLPIYHRFFRVFWALRPYTWWWEAVHRWL